MTHPNIDNSFVATHFLRDHPEILSLEKDGDASSLFLQFKDPSVFYKHADAWCELQLSRSPPNPAMRSGVQTGEREYNECTSYGAYKEKRVNVDKDPRFDLVAELTERLTEDLLRTGRYDVRKRGHDIYGDNPDVPRAISGDVMAMHLWKGKKQVDRLSLGVPFGGSCRLSAKFISNYGAAVAAMADALEHRGTRVRLVTGLRTASHGMGVPDMKTEIIVKEYSQHLDLAEIMQLWVQGDSFRRAWLCMVEMCTDPRWVSAYRSGYGSVRPYAYTGDELYVNLTPPDSLSSLLGNDATAAKIADHLFPLVTKQEASRSDG